MERGELGQEAEVKLRGQMLFEAYLSNFKQAIFEGWSLDALQPARATRSASFSRAPVAADVVGLGHGDGN